METKFFVFLVEAFWFSKFHESQAKHGNFKNHLKNRPNVLQASLLTVN